MVLNSQTHKALRKLLLFFCGSSSRPWLSTFLMLRPFYTVPCAVLTPKQKIILLLLPNCSFGPVRNCNANIWHAGYVTCNMQRGCNLQIENLYFSVKCFFHLLRRQERNIFSFNDDYSLRSGKFSGVHLAAWFTYRDLIWVVDISVFLHVKIFFEKHTTVHVLHRMMWGATETSAPLV